MENIAELMSEYAAISDRESLYARVLMSFINARASLVRQEIMRRVDVVTKDRERRVMLKQFARYAPLVELIDIYCKSLRIHARP